MKNRNAKVVIVGGGFDGLETAFYLTNGLLDRTFSTRKHSGESCLDGPMSGLDREDVRKIALREKSCVIEEWGERHARFI